MNEEAQLDLLSDLKDHEILRFRLADLHDDLKGRLIRFRCMEKLYYEKGGAKECFNCTSVELTGEDLDRLEADIRAKRLPHTEGFSSARPTAPKPTTTLPSSTKPAKRWQPA